MSWAAFRAYMHEENTLLIERLAEAEQTASLRPPGGEYPAPSPKELLEIPWSGEGADPLEEIWRNS